MKINKFLNDFLNSLEKGQWLIDFKKNAMNQLVIMNQEENHKKLMENYEIYLNKIREEIKFIIEKEINEKYFKITNQIS